LPSPSGSIETPLAASRVEHVGRQSVYLRDSTAMGRNDRTALARRHRERPSPPARRLQLVLLQALALSDCGAPRYLSKIKAAAVFLRRRAALG